MMRTNVHSPPRDAAIQLASGSDACPRSASAIASSRVITLPPSPGAPGGLCAPGPGALCGPTTLRALVRSATFYSIRSRQITRSTRVPLRSNSNGRLGNARLPNRPGDSAVVADLGTALARSGGLSVARRASNSQELVLRFDRRGRQVSRLLSVEFRRLQHSRVDSDYCCSAESVASGMTAARGGEATVCG